MLYLAHPTACEKTAAAAGFVTTTLNGRADYIWRKLDFLGIATNEKEKKTTLPTNGWLASMFYESIMAKSKIYSSKFS